MPGPARGSEGAMKIAAAHRGSHEHDKNGGFASDPSLAREAGRKGGQVVKERYGVDFYSRIGRAGGTKVREERGPEFYAEIGRKGGERRRREPSNEPPAPKRPVGRPRKSS